MIRYAFAETTGFMNLNLRTSLKSQYNPRSKQNSALKNFARISSRTLFPKLDDHGNSSLNGWESRHSLSIAFAY